MMDSQIGKIKLAIDRLASGYPFHAAILAQWALMADENVVTMGVGFRDVQLVLYYAPSFVAGISLAELTAVLLHEVNHVLFEHVFHKKAPRENARARLVAEEVTVNEWVAGPLPGTPILLAQYPYLPPNEDTDTRYKTLRRRIKDTQNMTTINAPSKPSSSGCGSGKSNSKRGSKPGPVDNHETWNEIKENASLAEMVIKGTITTAMAGLSENQRDMVGDIFINIGDGIGNEAGDEAGDEESSLGSAVAKVPWNIVLRRYVGRELIRRPIFGRPPRRYPHLVGIVPGKGRMVARAKIMAVIDTSSSLEDEELSAISAELAVINRTHSVTVVECDEKIQRVYPYHPIKSVKGRGGTDLRPPFKADFLHKHKPDLIVYFTDGQGPAPDHPPSVPVIWCLIPSGKKPAPWGTEIHMQEVDDDGICTQKGGI